MEAIGPVLAKRRHDDASNGPVTIPLCSNFDLVFVRCLGGITWIAFNPWVKAEACNVINGYARILGCPSEGWSVGFASDDLSNDRASSAPFKVISLPQNL
ncbi:hypothetical protein SCLCIDRAFT_32009 [Scleroderma citrinum Foug A]|uniref:Uncharacterized protein n=1 Tax=Scleroderma citrinum Foug A TaxID=1036808 RepID=A0A0C2ZKQ9_9AGAM|nr:hypothetical protein SCLCIDRAFT_32009 [Scleroderma citrinum Foug A]